MKSIKIIRKEVFASEEAILVFLAKSKLNWGNRKKIGKGGFSWEGEEKDKH